MAHYGLQARKLLWQQVSQRTPGLIRLSVDHIGQARIQTLLQQVVFGIEGLMQIESVGLQCGMRKSEPPYLLERFTIARSKVLVEARHQVRLGHQHIHREMNTQLLTQILQADRKSTRLNSSH